LTILSRKKAPCVAAIATHEADNPCRALYLRGDPYETSDAVFGVKESLLIDLGTVNAEQAKTYDVKEGGKLMSYDFVLVSEQESRELREKNAMDAMKDLGFRMKLYNGLPVPEVD
jgi:hypothetical protein